MDYSFDGFKKNYFTVYNCGSVMIDQVVISAYISSSVGEIFSCKDSWCTFVLLKQPSLGSIYIRSFSFWI